MKHTYIFEVNSRPKYQVTEDDLYRLADVLSRRGQISWKSEMSDYYYNRVQIFTDPASMFELIRAAGWSMDNMIKKVSTAKRRGDEAIRQAQAGLDNRRKEASAKLRAKAIRDYAERDAAVSFLLNRSQFNAVLELIHEELSLPENRDTKDIWVHAVRRALVIIRRSCKVPSAVGSPQMGSTAPTKRSKRSA